MRTTTTASNLIGGVSQQPAVLRLPSQAEEQINFTPSPIKGLTRRNPTEHISALGIDTSDAFYHWINRDSQERYLVKIRDNDLKVFDLEGTEYPVHGPTAPYDPFFGYLTVSGAPWDPKYFKALTVADYTFLLNTSRNIQLDNTVGDDLDSIAGRAYVQVVQGNYSSKYQITLGIESGPHKDQVFQTSTWDGDATNTENDGKQSIWQVWWKLQYVTPGDLSDGYNMGTPGHQWELQYKVSTGSTNTTIIASPATEVPTGTIYQQKQQAYEYMQAFAQGFIDDILTFSNLKVANFKVHGDTVYFDLQGPIDGSFNVSANFTDTPAVSEQSVTEIAGNTTAKLKSIKTQDIAADLAKRINNVSTFAKAKTFGSTIEITSEIYPLDRIDVEDSFGDGGMRAVNRKAQSFADLPTIAKDGYGVLVEGKAEALEDDYWVRFEPNDSDKTQTGSQGVWVEGTPLYPSTTFDLEETRAFLDTNMPFVLIRKQDDDLGTVTGDPDAIYFELGPGDWNTRDVGDENTNPPPSFVGKPIEDIFFFKNRLGFISGDRVIMSEAGRFFNFWRTTVRNLLDSDPIDVTASHVKAVTLKHAVPSQDNLVLFSDRAQLVLSADNLLTPRTVSINPVSDFEVSLSVRPVNLARSILFARKRGAYSSMVEHYRADEVSFDGQEITKHVPSFILGDVKAIAFCESENTIAVVADGLYIYNYSAQGGDLVQAAWHQYSLSSGTVLTAEFYEDTLYLVVEREDALYLERLSFSTSAVDPYSTFQVRVDRRIPDTDLESISYDTDTQRTTLVLPYPLGGTPAVTTRASLSVPLIHAVAVAVQPAVDTIEIPGDWTTTPLWIGESYESRYEFSPVTLKRPGPKGQELVLGEHIQVLGGKLVYEDSGYFRVEVTPYLRDTINQDFTGPILAVQEELGVLLDGVYKFSVMGKNQDTRIAVSSSSPLPCSLLTAEWTVNYHSR